MQSHVDPDADPDPKHWYWQKIILGVRDGISKILSSKFRLYRYAK
jgi:hypothetical protein